jgi:tetratricopeptide (TPR) repeat protein
MARVTTKARAKILLPALVVLAAVLPFANGLQGEFTFDDQPVIRDNALLLSSSPFPILQSPYPVGGGLYRPVTMLTYFANSHLFPSPFGFHVVNLVLHGLVSVLVFYLAGTLLRSAWMATVAALLFATHPIHTEAVTSIVGRAELLAALCVLTTLLAFVYARRTGGTQRAVWQTVSLLAFAAGLLAKESAFAALPLLGVVQLWSLRDETLRRRAALLIPYVVVTCSVFVLRQSILGSVATASKTSFLDNPLAYVSWPPRVRTAIVILWEQVSQLTLPLNLSADYSFQQIPVIVSSHDPRFLVACVLLLTAAVAWAWSASRAPAAFMAASLMLIPLLITANLLFPIGTIRAERLLYLPSVGWCLLCAWLAGQTARAHPRATVAILAILVVGYGGRTWARNAVWADNMSLFEATVEASPSSAKAHHNLATAHFNAGRFDEAMLHYREALAIYPDYKEPAFGVGRIYELKGLYGAALHWYELALHMDWNYVAAHRNVGVIRFRLGETMSAEASFVTGLQIDPRHPGLLENLAIVRHEQGFPWAAENALEKADVVRAGIMEANETGGITVARLPNAAAMEQR